MQWGGMGSSPHARGTLSPIARFETVNGIIPACAGNTLWGQSSMWPTRDHPRMRGEHNSTQSSSLVPKGSSPHARGTHNLRIVHVCDPGIIPACAGNTAAGFTDEYIHRDHPRMRGEHAAAGGRDGGHTGSSPHARGTRLMVLSLGLCSGIIPACAGNTP